MKKQPRLLKWIGISALLIFFGYSAQAREIVDATQARVRISDSPRRIVTLAPSLGELAADVLGDELERIVGVSEYTDYPPALSRVSSIGPYSHINLEAVAALKPDLVLATMDGNPRDQVLRLRELGLSVMVLDTRDFDQVADSMRKVAEALGKPREGIEMGDRFKKSLARLREKAIGRPRLKVVLQVGDQPLVVAGKNTFLHRGIEQIGAENAYADTQIFYPRPSLEDVLRRNPDVIVILALGKDQRPFHEMARRWSSLPQISAVRNGKVIVIPGDTVARPTMRLLEGLSRLERAVYE